MNVAQNMIRQGINPGDQHIVLADQQTSGRGRLNRTWVSLSGNLFCSLILQPQMPMHQWPQISFVAALALHEVFKIIMPDIDIELKWPNDVLLDACKVAGILLEIHSDAQQQNWLVIGLGINIVSSPPPLEIGQRVTYLNKYLKNTATIQQILNDFTLYFNRWAELWQHQGFDIIRRTWLQYAYNLHNVITVKQGAAMVTGLFTDVDSSGRMMISDDRQQIIFVSAGDVV